MNFNLCILPPAMAAFGEILGTLFTLAGIIMAFWSAAVALSKD